MRHLHLRHPLIQLTFGLPSVIRTDNGIPFTATTGNFRMSGVAVHLIEIGVSPEYIRKGCLYENGALERMQRTLHASVRWPRSKTFEEQQEPLDGFLAEYNLVRRSHEALGMRTPDEAYSPALRTQVPGRHAGARFDS